MRPASWRPEGGAAAAVGDLILALRKASDEPRPGRRRWREATASSTSRAVAGAPPTQPGHTALASAAAVQQMPDANLAPISVPGAPPPAEARNKALGLGPPRH